jgi:hypothetical protein
MASGRVLIVLAGLLAAGSVQAATPGVRLPLSLRGLEAGSDAVYHPTRWLSLRRSVAYVRAAPYDDMIHAPQRMNPRPRGYALTGDVHPFGDALRVSIGFREDDNRRLLRVAGDAADIGTGRYAPMATLGVAGQVADGIFLAGDVGLIGRAMTRPGDSLQFTALDAMTRDAGQGYRPIVQLSAGYRF